MVGNSTERNYMTESNEIFLIDSNILIYAYEEQDSIKKIKAQKLILNFMKEDNLCAISSQNLAEMASAFIVKGKGSPELIGEVVEDINKCRNFLKINYNLKTIKSALNIHQNFKTPFWDALIIATMKENNISNIYTENIKDFKVEGIKAINPLN